MHKVPNNLKSAEVSSSEGFREAYILHLADNSLIMGHRLSEWTGHGPMLEQDIAISNIALDLIGQARNFYQYAAELINVSKRFSFGADSEEAIKPDVTEDSLAYLRDAPGFKNFLIAELPNGDWSGTILKLFFFSAYQYFLYQKLFYSSDKQLSAIAEKSLKEVTYHLRWSSEWVVRLGDGTEESHNRIQKSLNDLWRCTGEMFIPSDYEMKCSQHNIGVDVSLLRNEWDKKVGEVLHEATLFPPPLDNRDIKYGGKQGLHTKNLKVLLKEMQYLQRAYPGCDW